MAVAFQSDTFGQRENDLFLARFADKVNPQNWEQETNDSYDGEWNTADIMSFEVEESLISAGYRVERDGGVFIYKA